MRKFYSVLLLTLVALPLFAQNIPSYIPKDAIFGYWPFNGNSNDESGNGRNGKNNQVVASPDRFGNLNSAYYFDGTTSYIEVVNSSNIELGGNDFTISVWVNNSSDVKTAGHNLIAKSTNTLVVGSFDNGSSGLPNSNVNYGVGFDTYGKNYGIYPDILPKTGWNHIVCVKSSSGYNFYINGKKYSLAYNSNNKSTSDINKVLYFGKREVNWNGENFKGYLDEIVIHKRVLTENEIQALYEGNKCPLSASISPLGPLKICEGSSIKLSANTGKNYTYQWVKDKVAIQGANTQEYIATKAGKYTVFINDGACKDTSDVITIDTIPLPAAPVINNSYLNVCNTMLREEVARQNQIDLNYRWYRSETGNDSLQKYEPLMPGYKQYYLSQFSATNPACESKKRTRVDVNMIMPIQINYPTTTTLCQGDSLKLEAFLNGNQWDYVWMKDYNMIPNTQGKTSIIVKETGNYSVTTMNCMNQGNQIINITFNPAPDAKISFTGSTILPVGGSLTLTVTDKQGNKYEWYKNGTLIQGASTNSYLAKEIGKYSVKVTNGTCSASSIPVELTGNNCNTDKPVVSSSQSFCGQAKVSDLKASGTDIKWYATTTGGSPLSITTALNNGSVYYASQTLNNCESTTRSAVNVIINSLPNATISPSGNLASICEGNSLIIKASGGTSYKWNSGETTSEIVVNTGGAHYADVINEFGCKKVVWLDVRVNPIPKVSIINLKSIIFKNEQNIPLNATPKGGVFSGEEVENDVLNLTKISLGSKFITYKYTDANGCTGLANTNVIVVDSIGNVCKVTNYDTVKVIKYDTIKVKESTYDTLKIKVQLTTGIKTGQLTSMNIYPNPTSDILIIEANDIQALSGYKYKIVDLQGKEVYNALATSAKTEISLKSIGTKGMYILHIVDEKGVSIENKKIVLE
jgi:hypothetical protein